MFTEKKIALGCNCLLEITTTNIVLFIRRSSCHETNRQCRFRIQGISKAEENGEVGSKNFQLGLGF